MAFSPRTFQEILTEMIAYVQSRTLISDFSVGSVVRTMLEAAALEDVDVVVEAEVVQPQW